MGRGDEKRTDTPMIREHVPVPFAIYDPIDDVRKGGVICGRCGMKEAVDRDTCINCGYPIKRLLMERNNDTKDIIGNKK